jgi:hypothetical protein
MRDSNVQLSCDANGWFGSFGIAVEAFVSDILTDGAPFEAEVTWDDPATTETVTIVAVVDGAIRTDTDQLIPLSDITRLEA